MHRQGTTQGLGACLRNGLVTGSDRVLVCKASISIQACEEGLSELVSSLTLGLVLVVVSGHDGLPMAGGHNNGGSVQLDR